LDKETEEWLGALVEKLEPKRICVNVKPRNCGFLTPLVTRAPNGSDLAKRIIDKIDLYDVKDLRGDSL